MSEGPAAITLTFYLIFQQLYELETQVNLATEPKAFLGAVSFLNLHCTVPDMGNLHQGWLCCSNERVFNVCRVDCLKYWVGHKKCLPVLLYHCIEKPGPTFGPTQEQGPCCLGAGPKNSECLTLWLNPCVSVGEQCKCVRGSLTCSVYPLAIQYTCSG